ncbi:MAG: SRPBCC domain-containing protein [Chitinispirillaceae bacterium]|nr:SRPBCC domain-containing protein [Chitinispirillaceae bacterium]
MPDKIWRVLNDFGKYPEWNPFIPSIQGKVSLGNVIKVKLTPPDAPSMTFKPKVLKIDPNRELRWLGRFIIPGLFDGEHIFKIIDNKNGTATFVQRELFTGVLVPFLRKMLDDNTGRGFELMNMKLKERCE